VSIRSIFPLLVFQPLAFPVPFHLEIKNMLILKRFKKHIITAAVAVGATANASMNTPHFEGVSNRNAIGNFDNGEGGTHFGMVASIAATPASTTYTAGSKLPPRIQWDANYGYCGEVSFISAGLNYGQYISQYDARALASKNAGQRLESSQLLLGVNDVAAAKAMHLTATAFNTTQQPTSTAFLTWVKSNVIAGYPVVIGVFMNQNRFYATTNLYAGDTEYDHIVAVTGMTSTRPLTGTATYYADDVLTFNDNGEWTTNGQPQNAFSFAFGTFVTTRQQANAKTAAVYSLKNGADYGIAITGIIDLSHETMPVRLTTSTNAETPAIVDGSNTRPAAKPVTLTITVSSLKPGTTYTLYRYNSMTKVPDSNINANVAKAAQKWTIKISAGSTYTMTQTINSNEIAVYRAVPVGAP